MIYLGKQAVGMNQLYSIDWDAVASGQSVSIYDNVVLSDSVTEITRYAFSGIPIKSISGKNVIKINQGGFYMCKKLESCNFPNLQIINSSGLRDTKINCLVAPNLYSIGGDAFYATPFNCIDIGNKTIQSFSGSQYIFDQNAQCITIFRYNFVIPANNNWFYSGSWMRKSSTPGILYVWQDLIDDYQNHAVWGTLLASNNNQILPIEGSIYETQYGDGTLITEGVTNNA